MTTHLVNLVLDTAGPRKVAEFWASLLGWQVVLDLPAEVGVRAPAQDGWELDLTFVPVPEAKDGKNRLHLDLTSGSLVRQAETVERALTLGAKRAGYGQGELSWVVLADPEGNEFCVLEPRAQYERSGAVASIVVDSHEPVALAAFWSAASGWAVGAREPGLVSLRGPSGRGPWLEFLRNEDVKRGKNRLHLDVAPPPGGSQKAEVERLCEAGAKVLRAPRGDAWWVLADPEGNEFCVLTPR